MTNQTTPARIPPDQLDLAATVAPIGPQTYATANGLQAFDFRAMLGQASHDARVLAALREWLEHRRDHHKQAAQAHTVAREFNSAAAGFSFAQDYADVIAKFNELEASR